MANKRKFIKYTLYSTIIVIALFILIAFFTDRRTSKNYFSHLPTKSYSKTDYQKGIIACEINGRLAILQIGQSFNPNILAKVTPQWSKSFTTYQTLSSNVFFLIDSRSNLVGVFGLDGWVATKPFFRHGLVGVDPDKLKSRSNALIKLEYYKRPYSLTTVPYVGNYLITVTRKYTIVTKEISSSERTSNSDKVITLSILDNSIADDVPLIRALRTGAH